MNKYLKEKLVKLLQEKEVFMYYLDEAHKIKKLAERITGKKVRIEWYVEEYESWNEGRWLVWIPTF